MTVKELLEVVKITPEHEGPSLTLFLKMSGQGRIDAAEVQEVLVIPGSNGVYVTAQGTEPAD